MNRFGLMLRGVRHHWRAHLGLGAGVTVTCAVISGALLTGDSVRHSLRRLAELRLGRASVAVLSADTFFGADLADRLGRAVHRDTASAILIRGNASNPDLGRRAGGVQIAGVDQGFWRLAPGGEADGPAALGSDDCLINQRLDRILGGVEGQWIVVRAQRQGGIAYDTAISNLEDANVAFRVRVRAVLSEDAFGRFSLQANPFPPPTVFVSQASLGKRLGAANRANLILVAEDRNQASGVGREEVSRALAEVCTLEDMGMKIRRLAETGRLELRSENVFMPDAIVDAVRSAVPTSLPILTYLVNEIAAGGQSTPYSFVAGIPSSWLPPGFPENGIWVNRWLADDLGVRQDERLRLDYYSLGPLRELIDSSAEFTVQGIVELRGVFGDPALMPDFPGIAEAGDCKDWDSGIPIDMSKIREKDEEYWDRYRGTPKAFVRYDKAQTLWRNRFGAATAIRFPVQGVSLAELRSTLRKHIPLGAAGISVRDIAGEAARAGGQGVDFAQLFLGLSLFVIIAALLLTAFLFALFLDMRKGEIATFRALGFERREILGLFLGESAVAALPAAVAGSLFGILYNVLIVHALGGPWRGAVGGSPLFFQVTARSLILGSASGLLASGFSVWLVIRGGAGNRGGGVRGGLSLLRLPVWAYRLLVGGGLACLIAAAFWGFLADPGRGKAAAGAFFGIGSLALVGFLSLPFALLGRPGGWGWRRFSLTVRNACRRPLRSLGVIAVMACAVFVTIAVGANRHGPMADADKRSSGTGGFAFFGELGVPVYRDLNGSAGRKEVLGWEPNEYPGLRFVHLAATDGDDASCLNLNRTSRPRILGVVPAEFDSRQAFSVIRALPEVDLEHPWLSLDASLPNGRIPAFADASVIAWGLGKRVGDELAIMDEKGETAYLKFMAGTANSILQGSVIISREHFAKLFPSRGGSRILLVDAPKASRASAGERIRRALGRKGIELTTTAERLLTFNQVENTYLSIFLSLGGLGLVLGSVGLGVMVVRNVLERRGELALLTAVGYSRGALVGQLVREHSALFLAGVLAGGAAGCLAVLPALASGQGKGAGEVFLLLGGILVCGFVWIRAGARAALRGDLVDALRNE